MPRKLDAPHPCNCRTFSVENETTGCGAQTRRTYAPGHDARLAGFLISAGVRGLEVTRTVGGIRHGASAQTTAENNLSAALVAKVVRGIQGQLELRDARATARRIKDRPAELTPKQYAEHERKTAALAQAAYQAELRRPTPTVPEETESDYGHRANIKVGRWTYENAWIDSRGLATYSDAKGVEHTTSKYAEV